MKLPSPKRKPQPAPVSFDADALRSLLRAAEMTGLSVVALDPTGAPLGEGEELFECPLCRARARRGLSLCRRRTQEAARTAATAGTTHIYPCHDDIVSVAVPLFGTSGVVACLCAGPAWAQAPSRTKIKRLVDVRVHSAAQHDAVCRALFALPIISEEKMHALSQLLAGAGYFVMRGEHPLYPEMAEMRLVIDLVRGNVRTNEEAAQRMAYLGRRFVPAIVLVADVDDFARKTKGLSEVACHLLKESVLRAIRLAVGESLTAMISGDSVVVILGPPNVPTFQRSEEEIHRRAMELAEKACRAVRERTNVTVTLGVGRAHVGALAVHKSYLEAQSAVYQKRLLGKDRVFFIGAVEPEGQAHEAFPMRAWQELLTALRSGDREAVRARLKPLLAEHVGSPDADGVRLKNFALQLVTRAAEVAAERGLVARVTASLPFEFARAVEDLTAPADIARALTEQLLSLTDAVAGLSARWATERIELARRYVDAHLASPLTLDKVCREAVHLSPFHFSRLFKKQTGESFIQYLNRARVERAQNLLLNSDMTVDEISASVGYSSQHYFSRVFRRLTGVSPNQFRSRMRDEG